MKTAAFWGLLLAGSTFAAACQVVPPVRQEGLPIIAAPPVPPEHQEVRLTERRGAFPALVISVPPGWHVEGGAGEDTYMYSASGGGARVRIEFWAFQSGASYSLSMGGKRMGVADRYAELALAPDGLSWRAFVPMTSGIILRDGPGPMQGIDVRAECASRGACDVALQVLASVRFS